MLVRSLRLAVICAVFSVLPAWAHHSHGNYDVTTWTTMEGTVREVHLLVPHSWIYLEVKDSKGELTTWALEATGPGGLQRVQPRPLQEGDALGRDERVPGPLGDVPDGLEQPDLGGQGCGHGGPSL